MSARVLVSGVLHRCTRKTGAKNNTYLMVTIREGSGDAVRWWTAFAFREFIAQNQRERIITALVDTVAERGYNATTVAHITKAASVSRRTFYEHFADKEACFLAAYEMVADHIRDSMKVAADV